jgi:hypothetical protein
LRFLLFNPYKNLQYKNEMASVFSLPYELISRILELAGGDSAFSVALVCRAFAHLQRERLRRRLPEGATLYKTPAQSVVTSVRLCAWAKDLGCPWNASICAFAALKGNFEVLEWAKANDCAWDWRTYEWAGKAGHLKLQQWALDHGCPTGGTSPFIFEDFKKNTLFLTPSKF